MMISPEAYAMLRRNYSLKDLIKERKSLQREIASLEKIVFDESRFGEEWMEKPGPDVRYQMTLEYLAELCHLIVEKYREESEEFD